MQIPFHELRPEHIARLIVWMPDGPRERRVGWRRKREMKVRPSRPNKPRADDLKRLALAKDKDYWRFTGLEYHDEFPVLGVMQGPLMASGRFYSHRDEVFNPITLRVHESPDAEYRRSRFEYDTAMLRATKGLLWRAFVDGQTHQGPVVDGVVYIKADKLLDAEIAYCKARFEYAQAVKRQNRVKNHKQEIAVWDDITPDMAVAAKKIGMKVRFIGKWQVCRE